MGRRVAIITGAGSGLGLSLAKALAANGHSVVGVGRRKPPPSWASVAAEASFVVGDAAADDVVDKTLSTASSLGSIKLVINCAGVGEFGPAGTYSAETVRDLFAGSVFAMINFCEASVDLMRDGGTIVNVLSTTALSARAGESVYSAAKWAGRGYTEALQLELRGQHPSVLAVYPGGMDTAFWSEEDRSTSHYMNPDDVAKKILQAVEFGATARILSLTIDRAGIMETGRM